ncbi:hypothetical protein [Nonomuraea sp. NPDC050643]|uniref:hypothetical protein n=1 Tax=Nonomuraea sp. NPDC050643 TaxID=3155660 RepID=UPI00340AE80A
MPHTSPAHCSGAQHDLNRVARPSLAVRRAARNAGMLGVTDAREPQHDPDARHDPDGQHEPDAQQPMRGTTSTRDTT